MKDKTNSDGSTTIGYNNESNFQGVVLVTATKINPIEWVLDSSCFFHMYHIREWYAGFTNLNGVKFRWVIYDLSNKKY